MQVKHLESELFKSIIRDFQPIKAANELNTNPYVTIFSDGMENYPIQKFAEKYLSSVDDEEAYVMAVYKHLNQDNRDYISNYLLANANAMQ